VDKQMASKKYLIALTSLLSSGCGKKAESGYISGGNVDEHQI